MIKKGFFIVFIAFIFGFKEQSRSSHNPMFFDLEQEFNTLVKDQELIEFTGQDTTVVHQLRVLSDELGAPRLFYSDIETPVCADGECKLAKIKVYWNLLGNYVGFGVSSNTPLTKNEHDPFTKGDYKKLHQLLGDKHSVLERRKMEDLIDEVPVVGEALKAYKGIDAISGATKKEIKESVVKGGLYSCYTLWHLVHGDVVNEMKSHLKTIYSEATTHCFMQSYQIDYQEYGLKKLSQDKFEDYLEEIISIYHRASPITRSYILKKIPNDLFQKEFVSGQFYTTFQMVDSNTRTQLIQKLNTADKGSSYILIDQVGEMTKNQLRSYLNFFKQNPSLVTLEVKKSFKKHARSKEFQLNYLVKDFLATL